MAIEQASYTTLLKEGSFEIRQTDPMIVAVTPDRSLGGDSGFSTIFNYISGDNKAQKKIDMTTPVINTFEQESMTTAFVMPKRYAMEDLPLPRNAALKLTEVPSRLMAVVTFSGSVNSKRIQEQQQALTQWIRKQNAFEFGSFQLARYNPPFIPGFLKRNEVMIEIRKLP